MKIISAPTAPLYSEPDLRSEHIDEALFGMSLDILDTVGCFYKVNMFYGYEGYVEKIFVCDRLHEPNMMVCVSFADLLPEGKNFYRPILTLPQGALVDVGFSEKFKRYGFLVLPTKRVYYIHRNHIKTLPKNKTESQTRTGLKRSATSYLGTQYRWGGKTHSGIDCSGLAWMTYYLNGIQIYRDADIKRSPNLRSIPFSEAKIGDLLYFPGHMAVYIGNDEFIHSSAEQGMVCINSFDSKKSNYNEYLAKNLLYTGTIF